MKEIAALIKKDLVLELRTKETLALLLSLSVLLSVICVVGINSAFLPPGKAQLLFPGMLWVISIFTATLSIGRSYEYELENSALEGMLLTGVSPWRIYLAKLSASFLLIFVGQIVTVACLSVLLDVPVMPVLGRLFVVSALTIIGYSSLATLLSGVASTASLKNMLLPIILLPLLFPLFFAAIELTAGLLTQGVLDVESVWLSLLVGIDVIYFVLGVNLFEYVVRE